VNANKKAIQFVLHAIQHMGVYTDEDIAVIREKLKRKVTFQN